MAGKIYIVIKQNELLHIGDVFEQTIEGFVQQDKIPYRSKTTGQLAWKYEQHEPAILWPYESVAPFVIEIQKPE